MEHPVRENLREAIARSGLYIKEIADKSGVYKATIDNWVGNRPTIPRVTDLVAVARILDVSAEWVVDRTESPSSLAFSLARRPILRHLAERLVSLRDEDILTATAILEAAKIFEPAPEAKGPPFEPVASGG